MPYLKKHLANKVDSVTSYLLLYHEATVANLLEVSLYHSHAAEACSEDAMLELVDWCHRKMIYLNNEGHRDANPPGSYPPLLPKCIPVRPSPRCGWADGWGCPPNQYRQDQGAVDEPVQLGGV